MIVQLPSTKPYLLRALWDWCFDQGFTPYIAVQVDARTKVPLEHVRDGQIVLNIAQDATSCLKIGNEWIEFQARFGGAARELSVPVGQVVAIYAKENGAGMAFEVDPEPKAEPVEKAGSASSPPKSAKKGPSLRVVK